MEKYVKPSIFLGAILGFIFGIILLIPFFAPLMFFFMFVIAGIITIIVLKKTGTIGFMTLQDGCTIGAIAGFFSLLATSILYLPAAYLIDLFFNTYSGGFSISRSLSITGYDLMVITMLVFFTALLSAIINAFTAMLTVLLFEKLENKNIKFEDHLYMSQFDDTIE